MRLLVEQYLSVCSVSGRLSSTMHALPATYTSFAVCLCDVHVCLMFMHDRYTPSGIDDPEDASAYVAAVA